MATVVGNLSSLQSGHDRRSACAQARRCFLFLGNGRESGSKRSEGLLLIPQSVSALCFHPRGEHWTEDFL